ncbi:hypothetical protein FisN_22Lu267 [Fistulifera solaris]|uniref:Uncharacterized protein n=1 Tax=Fistulifera solaris TaxID=1519565 RepID=A0A1Z5JCE0_FISSO|nr:hypothetical protein FisN_22Lu267 [Fistulifera solaris]|eukprot:GAX11562.1 hypothetical protein FisN_22Lu267 [Fistulifera solaris]
MTAFTNSTAAAIRKAPDSVVPSDVCAASEGATGANSVRVGTTGESAGVLTLGAAGYSTGADRSEHFKYSV